MRAVGLIALLVIGFLVGLAAGLKIEESMCFKKMDFDRRLCAQNLQIAVDAATKHQRDICKRGLR